ncbi:BrnA antitoxin family protein [Imhoffiella purpurea]|uniref:BrnA antitoxin family protein n=1 Tax=Imhoffiella purpurea TaxID=1249627 RepID=W9V685_9GAMM|nr:BrnA antitoxin family protein [Imhoffiella purpurea]EXJ14874.1 hypothetical protein D779_2080 [Imhoffiella purpurea]
MKRDNLPAGFPATPEEWEKIIAEAPDHVDDPDCPYDPNDPDAVAAYWADAAFTPGGGYPAVKAALEERRRTRGPQKAPTKISTTIRFDADVLDGLKATGKGWQTRVNDAMREWLERRS